MEQLKDQSWEHYYNNFQCLLATRYIEEAVRDDFINNISEGHLAILGHIKIFYEKIVVCVFAKIICFYCADVMYNIL